MDGALHAVVPWLPLGHLLKGATFFSLRLFLLLDRGASFPSVPTASRSLATPTPPPGSGLAPFACSTPS